MGAAPRLALLSLALPPTLPLADFDAHRRRLRRAGRARIALHVVGGNLTRSPGPLIIDVTVVGTVKRRQVLTRAGARPGDDLYVSGTIGAAAAGLELLQRCWRSDVAGVETRDRRSALTLVAELHRSAISAPSRACGSGVLLGAQPCGVGVHGSERRPGRRRRTRSPRPAASA